MLQQMSKSRSEVYWGRDGWPGQCRVDRTEDPHGGADDHHSTADWNEDHHDGADDHQGRDEDHFSGAEGAGDYKDGSDWGVIESTEVNSGHNRIKRAFRNCLLSHERAN